MSLKTTFKSVLIIACLLLQFNLQAMTIHVATAGTLPTLISPADKYKITSLTLTGDLNGTDILLIREMAGNDVNGHSTAGQLANLDLSGANIVAGGRTYYYYHYYDCNTSDNSISSHMFYDCLRLTQVVLPNSVTAIGHFAFFECTGLTSVNLGTGLTSIGYCAFSECTGLTGVTIPNSVTTIGDFAFSECTDLTSVSFGTSMTGIEEYAFSGCTGLTTITIPNSVTTIGDHAFFGCTGLTNLSLGTGVTSIGEAAFANCTDLTGINVATGNIDYLSTDGVLFNVSKTQLIAYPAGKSGAYTIPNSVTTIEGYTFSKCTGLTGVTIPNSVTKIEEATFFGCTGLTTITIPNSVTTIEGHTFSHCTGLTGITIPNSVTWIGDHAFSYCTGLMGVTISNSVTSIGHFAFLECTGLTSITIPSSVITIWSHAFENCRGLKKIYSKNPTPPECFDDCFKGVNTDTCILYVPASSSAAYRAVPEWRNFNVVIEEGPTTAINSVESDAGSIVFTREGGIRVELPESMPVAVYTVSGQRVYASVLQGGSTQIDLNSGIYVVRLGNRSSKVIVK